MIDVYQNVMSKHDIDYMVNKIHNGSNWRHGGASTSSECVFWYMDLMKDSFFNWYMLGKIEELTSNKYMLLDVYANGQTHGLSGSYHRDSDNPNDRTFLYYLNPVWQGDWGGGTVFNDGTKEYIHPYTPNAGVLFNGTILHAGLEPSRLCRDLRVTVAFKLRINDE